MKLTLISSNDEACFILLKKFMQKKFCTYVLINRKAIEPMNVGVHVVIANNVVDIFQIQTIFRSIQWKKYRLNTMYICVMNLVRFVFVNACATDHKLFMEMPFCAWNHVHTFRRK